MNPRQPLPSLADKVVLVTRPAHQSAGMLGLLEQAGAKPLAFPCIEITGIKLNDALKQQLVSLKTADLLIFISTNAVQYACRLLDKAGVGIETISAQVAVIGKATRRAAQQAGFCLISDHTASKQTDSGLKKSFNSDALLQRPELQGARINAKKAAIIRGVGGLQQLGDTLLQRGARVEYIEVYRRGPPQQDIAIQRQQLSCHWDEMNIHAVSVTSNESLQNLYDMLEPPGRDEMLKSALIVPSNRCMLLAQSMGFESIRVAESASDTHMLDALVYVLAEVNR
ncbi:Uroporphyrinogen-III synthase [hydrothermal vent metagenome]|uniref:uroporphyrinogen-III synthase n=1 Tax=hydrothermal vent metagenome TaxID=652676 RepID=A0A3B0XJA1_9ZZZZ